MGANWSSFAHRRGALAHFYRANWRVRVEVESID
jgi:hypothetical protein